MNKKLFVPGILLTGLLLSGTVHAAEPQNTTVDGTATYFSTGEIAPSKVQFAGYDVRNKEMHLNLAIESADESTPLLDTNESSIQYSVSVFNTGSVLNTVIKEELMPPTENTKIVVNDLSFPLENPLTKDYSIVVEVNKDHEPDPGT